VTLIRVPGGTRVGYNPTKSDALLLPAFASVFYGGVLVAAVTVSTLLRRRSP